jgi:hypothetical protein
LRLEHARMPILIDRLGDGLIAPDAELESKRDALALALTEAEQSALFKFELDADAELRAILEFKAREIERPNTPPTLAQWLDKLPNEFGRVALVFHFIECHAAEAGAPTPGATPHDAIAQGALFCHRCHRKCVFRAKRVQKEKELRI